jgi:NitT/TauT family transport system permease protein
MLRRETPVAESRAISQGGNLRLSRLALLGWRAAVLGTVLFGWEASARLHWIDPYLFSSPGAIGKRLWHLAASGVLFGHVWITVLETLMALVVGATLGISLGMFLALCPRIAKILDPFNVALNGLPRAAMAPLFVVWFGIGAASKIAVGASIVVFVCLFATYAGMRNTDVVLLRAVRALGATPRQVLLWVELPFAIPWIFAGLRTSVAMALIGTIIGEYVAASKGLGWYIAYSGGIFDTTGVMAGLLVLGIIAVGLDVAVERIGRKLTPWKPDDLR